VKCVLDGRVAPWESGLEESRACTREKPSLRLDGIRARPVRRGLILRNLGVGGVALRLQTFWFDGRCTNHRIPGARDVVDLREGYASAWYQVDDAVGRTLEISDRLASGAR